ncbi:peptidylprolyl isomerase [Oribacterium parvum]|uniref:peptidylprolyl isomerase n=1 Tax=Oribacterium parvum TaxID=1501329 RepID=UPI0028DCAF8A|nr:peptidylprolyl isomerase [Oribacterium parvum]
MRKSFVKLALALGCALFGILSLTAFTGFAKNYDDEVQTWQMLSRRWDETLLQAREEEFIKAIKEQKGIEDFIVPDIAEEEKEVIRNFFRNFEGKKDIRYIYSKMPILHRVSGTDEYNDLRGIMELKFQVTERSNKVTEHTVLMKMAQLGDAQAQKWKIIGILWQDKGIDVSDVSLYQLEKPRRGEEVCIMTTDAGVIKLRLFPKKAPIAVQNWITLSKQGFYNGTPFARVIKDYVIQGGALDGSGDESKSSYNGFFQDEVNMELHNFNGALCLGNNGPHTNGNQFYIVQCSKVRNETSLPIISFPENVKAKYREVGGIPELDGRYTVLGQVYEGMDVVEKIASQETNEDDAPVSNPINIQSIRFQKY